ncbi:MAG TPA: glycosyltransferase family 39 protein, partial [Actinomycetota bacterium]|nr:glycosyltransferase family 39 protein [Actinomycetota bacterium]
MRAALGGRWAAVAGVASLTAASAVLRTEGLRVRLWLDEAISVGIASQPLGAIPGLMRRDGSPPLYYLLLHGWMEVAGQSEAALHLLSLAFGVAVVPVAYWAGRSLFGRRVGWMAAAMAAANPYITRYSVEVRMYTLLVLLSLVCVTCFVHAFVHGRRRWLPAFVLSLALTMYTHNWGLFLALSLGVTALALGFRNGRSSVARTAAPFAVVGVLYAPWIPTLLAQARDVGAPWSKSPGLREVIWSAGAVFGDERA